MKPRVLSGQSSLALTVDGIKQAKCLSQRLSKKTFSFIYTSDSQQCLSTTQEIKALQPDAVVVKDERLREMDLGALTGLNWTLAKKQLTKLQLHFDQYLEKEAECTEKLNNRVMQFYSELIHTHLAQRHDDLISKNPVSLNQVKNKLLHMDSKKSLTGSIDSVNSSGTSTPNRMRMNNLDILIVTHGGWIDSLFKQLIDDLHFHVSEKIIQHSFPKISSIFQFNILKIIQDEQDDYEWKGEIKIMNSVSHFASIKNINLISKKTPLNNEISSSVQSSPDVTPENTPPTKKKSYLRLLGIGKDRKSFFYKTNSGSKSDPLSSQKKQSPNAITPQSPKSGQSPRMGSPKASSPSSYKMSPSKGSPRQRVKSLGW